MEKRISVSINDGVADVRMVRVDKMNALDDGMFDALITTGERLKTEKGVRAVVLSGEGRAFCAGLDTGNFQKMASGERRGGAGLVGERTPGGANRAQHAVLVWREVPVPVIAAVHGVAYGGGFQLTLGADVRLVTPDVKLSVMEIEWGLVPDMGAFVLAPRLIRDDLFRELTYSGRVFNGAEAVSLGLATRVCTDPHAEALALAAGIASRSPHAIRAAKRLFALDPSDRLGVLKAESEEQAALIGAPNQVEAVVSKMQKRPSKFADVE
ncbi:MAG: crotonase/enoyl-CoA hydratase family protein [Alphaproteobacteria bacterium]|nr:crotonase/enoyl-CoA hydratase family protein [Alphaproteobacteria bacterium]